MRIEELCQQRTASYLLVSLYIPSDNHGIVDDYVDIEELEEYQLTFWGKTVGSAEHLVFLYWSLDRLVH